MFGCVGSVRMAKAIFAPVNVLEEIFVKLSARQLLRIREICWRFKNIVENCATLRDKFHLEFGENLLYNSGCRPLPASHVRIAYVTIHRSSIAENSTTYFTNVPKDSFDTFFWWWPKFGQTITELFINRAKIPLDMLRYTPNVKHLDIYTLHDFEPFSADFTLDKIESFKFNVISSRSLVLLGQIITKPLRKIDFSLSYLFASVFEFVEARQEGLEDLRLGAMNTLIFDNILQLKQARLKQFSTLMTLKIEQILQLADAHSSIEALDVGLCNTSQQVTRFRMFST